MKKNKIDAELKRVINFSGGKTSALMTILLKPTNDDIVLFTDTGREHPATYKFIDDFEKYEGIKVHRVSYEHDRAPGLTGFDAMTSWKSYLPNRVKRICTDELKIKTSKRYLRKLGVRSFYNYIGFRADEPQRVIKRKNNFKNVFDKFPLYDQGVTKEMVNQYWLSKSYTLEIPSILGNCDLCFLKGKDNIIKILQIYPELADKWIKDEEDRKKKSIKATSKGQYFPDATYRDLLNAAQNQKTLFDLDNALPAFNCSCTN
jgi:hypothetical protein